MSSGLGEILGRVDMNCTLLLRFRGDIHPRIQAKRAAMMTIVVNEMLQICFGGEVKGSKQNQTTAGGCASVWKGHRKTLVWFEERRKRERRRLSNKEKKKRSHIQEMNEDADHSTDEFQCGEAGKTG